MSATCVNQKLDSINPRVTKDFPEYEYEYRFVYQPLPDQQSMFLGDGAIHVENPLDMEWVKVGYRFEVYDSSQPDYKFEWEVVRTDLFLPQRDDTYSGVIFCFCQLLCARLRGPEDTGKPEVLMF